MKYNCVVCVCLYHFDFETSWKIFSQKGGVCNGFEITSTSEKLMVEDNVLFTNCQAVIMGISSARAQCLTSALTLDHQCLLGWLWPAQTSSSQFSLV